MPRQGSSDGGPLTFDSYETRISLKNTTMKSKIIMSSQNDAPQTAICTADGVSLVQIQVNARVPETRVSATVAADSVTTYGDGRHLIDLQQENVRRRRGIGTETRSDAPYPAAIYPVAGALAPKGLGLHSNLGQGHSTTKRNGV
jgi:hypothetical protein